MKEQQKKQRNKETKKERSKQRANKEKERANKRDSFKHPCTKNTKSKSKANEFLHLKRL